MTIQAATDRQARIKLRLRIRGFAKEAEYFEMILAIQELIEDEIRNKHE